MSDYATKRCDVCSELKREANKWWVLVLDCGISYTVYPADRYHGNGGPGYLDLCSEGCLNKQEGSLRAAWLNAETPMVQEELERA